MRIVPPLALATTLWLSIAFVGASGRHATTVRLAAAEAPGATASPTVRVDTKDFAYNPDTITVAAGTTVQFRNSDEMAHTITASDGSFDSGNMEKGATWTHTFTKPGTYAYTCAYHAYMRGTIVVKQP